MKQNNFNPWIYPCAPTPPTEPKEFYETRAVIGELELKDYEDISKENMLQLIKDSDCAYLRVDFDSYCIKLISIDTVKNLSYNKDLETYNKKLATYKKEYEEYQETLKTWKELSRKFQEEQGYLKVIEEEKKMLKELYDKYGSPYAEKK